MEMLENRPTIEEIKETPWEIFAEQIKMGGKDNASD